MGLGNFQYAVLGLVASREDGIHGYGLKRDCDAISDEFWEINYGSVYRLLDDLEKSGYLAGERQIQSNRPNRKVFRITERGRETLDDWLLQPIAENPHPLRNELALKLLFLRSVKADGLYDLIKQQREIYIRKLAIVSRRRKQLRKVGLELEVADLVMDSAEMKVRADLAWLEHVERKILRSL